MQQFGIMRGSMGQGFVVWYLINNGSRLFRDERGAIITFKTRDAAQAFIATQPA
jgi:hypothetical protein